VLGSLSQFVVRSFGKVMAQQAQAQQNRDFLLAFKPLTKEAPLNILLFGETCIGKSSLINTINSLHYNSVKEKVAVRGPQHGFKTTHSIEYVAIQITNNLSVWDTFGWVPGCNYSPEMFKNMLLGKYESKSHMDSMKASALGNPEYEIDVVIFVTDINTDPNQVAALGEFYKVAKNEGKLCVVAITKVDEAPGKPRTLSDAMSNETYLKVSDRFYIGWNVDSTQISIFPIVNYKHGVKVKSEELEGIVFFNDLLGIIAVQ